jgi:hypothetical protein
LLQPEMSRRKIGEKIKMLLLQCLRQSWQPGERKC